MTPVPPPLTQLGSACAFALWLLGLAARPAVAAAPALETQAPAAVAPVLLAVNADDRQAFSAVRVREALVRALGRPVVLLDEAGGARRGAGTLTLTFRPSRHELAVTWDEGERGTVSRIVAAPADVDEAIAAGVQLGVNLVHREADELLGAARAPAPPLVRPARQPPVEVALEASADAPRPYTFATAALLFPLATNYDRPEVRTRLAFGLLHSRIGALEGLQVGLLNQVTGPATGAQLALGANLAGRLDGFQIAPAFNVVDGATSGLQAALGFNRTGGEVAGVQTSLVYNGAGNLRGVQATCGLNTAKDVEGVQLALVNVARRVRGMQIGLVNVAEDVKGLPIGLVSVTESGGVHPVAWASSTAYGNLGLKFATRYTYSLFSVSGHREERAGDHRSLFGPGLALGARLPLQPLAFEADLGATYLLGGKLCCVSQREGLRDDVLLGRLRVLAAHELHRRFTIFIGGALTLTTRFYQNADEDATLQLGPELFGGVQL